MAFSDPVVEAGVAGLAAIYRARLATPVEAVEAYLGRIERLNPAINAFLDVDGAGAREGALASGARWAAGRPLSPLDGIPIGVKANIAVRGLPWHAGIAAYRDRIAAEDADCVARLRAAGAIILGTLNLHEGALGSTTDNPKFGRCENPHRQGFIPGGSSGGSGAAVAAAMCAAALGTDTMGSVRIPSAYCGVFGLKPAKGRVASAGLVPLSWTLDTIGPHGRSAEDCGLVLAGMAEIAETVTDSRPLATLDWSGQVDVEPAVEAAARRTVERARRTGLTVETITLRDYDFGAVRRLGLLISEVEGHVVHEAMLAQHPEGFSDTFAQGLAWGARQPAPRLAKAYRELHETAARLRAVLRPYRGLLLPTSPQTAFAFGAPVPANQADFTALANVVDLPAAAFPVGETDGLPLSMQVMTWEEGDALRLAKTLAEPINTPPGFAA